jgi:ATP-binding cassette, subfamily F, member 3
MISINQLTVQFSGIDLFKDITFLINPKDKIGLVGKNGAGKSTMLKVLLGEIEPSGGSISIAKDVSIGYLPQQMVLQSGRTVMQEALTAFWKINQLNDKINRLSSEIISRTDYESDSYMKLIEDMSVAGELLAMEGGGSEEGGAEQALLGLGFERTDFDRQTTEFSGGWRMRIELAKILLQKPSVMLLDEPTNHLDIESIQWLENFMKAYSGALVLISHDRAFLDAITTRTVEISLGKIYDYKASYSRYLDLRAERIAQQTAAYENQQKLIGDTEQFINRFRYQATKANQVQSRIKQLDKIDRIEIDHEDSSSIHFRFPAAPRSGKVVIEAKGCSKSYGDNLILENVEVIVERGQKVAFLGRNGEGKSTFSKMIMGQIGYDGELVLGHNVKIGYFAQNQDELLAPDKTVFQTLDDIAAGEARKKVRDILGSFLFSGEDVDKKVKVLSGGERNRLAMAKLLLEPYNLLLLDEPTNHLDIRSKDILKQAIAQYDGTVVLVSHDRDFLDGLVSHVYEFKYKKVKEYLGGITEFLEKKKIDSITAIERKDKPLKTENKTGQAPKSKWAAQEKDRERDKEIKQLQNKLKKCEAEAEQAEAEMTKLKELLAIPENYRSELVNKFAESEKILEAAMEKWMEAQEEIESIQQNRD